jgi:hypothetical protein
VKSQHINLLQQVVTAITNLATQGDSVGVVVVSVLVKFPDGSHVNFTQDTETTETDWHILHSGPTGGIR